MIKKKESDTSGSLKYYSQSRRQVKYNYQSRCTTQEDSSKADDYQSLKQKLQEKYKIIEQMQHTIDTQKIQITTLIEQKNTDNSPHQDQIYEYQQNINGLQIPNYESQLIKDLEINVKLFSNENKALTAHLERAQVKLERKKKQLKGYQNVMKEQQTVLNRLQQLTDDNTSMSNQLDCLQRQIKIKKKEERQNDKQEKIKEVEQKRRHTSSDFYQKRTEQEREREKEMEPLMNRTYNEYRGVLRERGKS